MSTGTVSHKAPGRPASQCTPEQDSRHTVCLSSSLLMHLAPAQHLVMAPACSIIDWPMCHSSSSMSVSGHSLQWHIQVGFVCIADTVEKLVTVLALAQHTYCCVPRACQMRSLMSSSSGHNTSSLKPAHAWPVTARPTGAATAANDPAAAVAAADAAATPAVADMLCGPKVATSLLRLLSCCISLCCCPC